MSEDRKKINVLVSEKKATIALTLPFYAFWALFGGKDNASSHRKRKIFFIQSTDSNTNVFQEYIHNSAIMSYQLSGYLSV